MMMIMLQLLLLMLLIHLVPSSLAVLISDGKFVLHWFIQYYSYYDIISLYTACGDSMQHCSQLICLHNTQLCMVISWHLSAWQGAAWWSVYDSRQNFMMLLW